MNVPTYFTQVVDLTPPTWGEDCIVGSYPVLGVQPISNAANRRPINSEWPSGHIGDRTIIGHFAVIGAGVKIGADCRIGDHVNIREGVTIGDRCVVGSHVDIQWECQISDDVKIFNQSQITGGSKIARGVFIGPGLQSMNDIEIAKYDLEDYQHRGQIGFTIEEYAFIGGAVIILPAVRIGRKAVVASGALVTRDVSDGVTVQGFPARPKTVS